MPAKLSETTLLLVFATGPERITIQVADDEEVTRAVWTLANADGDPVKLPKFGVSPRYEGARADPDKDGISLLAGTIPIHSMLSVQVRVTVKTTTGTTVSTLGATVRFSESWGGYAQAVSPFPANYEIPWDADPKGRRAVVLLYEMIRQLPAELCASIGSIPIVRTADDSGLRGAVRGKHVPIWHDAFLIGDALVAKLDENSPDPTVDDIEFVAVVLHELVHAATYRKALWDAHQDIAGVRRDMRTLSLYRKVVAGVAIGMVFTMTAIRKLLAPDDLIGEWSEITGWELGPVAAALIASGNIATGKVVYDIGNYLWRIPGEGLLQKNPIRPNLATGFQPLAGFLGLHIEGSPVTPLADAEKAALTDWSAKQDAVAKASPAELAERKKQAAEAENAYFAARGALDAAAITDGIVSLYAATDPVEEIPETAVYLLFEKGQLAMLGEYLNVPLTHPKLVRKHQFFVAQGMFPEGALPVVEIGRYWKGSDRKNHLNHWTVEL